MERLGWFVARRARLVVAGAIGALVLLGLVAAQALGALSLSRVDAPGSESDIVRQQLDSPAPNLVFLVTAETTVDEPETARLGTSLTDLLAREDGVASAESYWSRNGDPLLRSKDARQALVLVRVPGDVNAARARVAELTDKYTDGTRVQAGGQDVVFREIGAQARQDFLRAEMIVVPAVLLMLFLYYRRVGLALVTIGIGVFAIVASLAVVRVIAAFTSVSTFAANISLVMGLALGVDYCLLMVARFREELVERTPREAAARTVKTAGRTVLLSGATVAASLMALLLFPLPFLRSFGYAGAIVVASAVLGAVVVLPAILALMGEKALPKRRVEHQWWGTVARVVMRRPVLIGGTVLVGVLVVASPALGVVFGSPDARILPETSTSRAVADQVRTGFVAEESDALWIVGPANADQVAAVEGIERVDRVGDALRATPSQAALADQDLVKKVRDAAPDAMVGGSPAEMYDWRTALQDRLPLVLIMVLLVTMVLLFLVTGSVVLPLKATVLNLLSLGVMFGVLVWVFQDGNLAGLLGFTATGTLEASIPILMFCVAYGLSMDYEVFLVSRIKEEYDRGLSTTDAVIAGVRTSAPLVTAAAGIMAVSFAVYATGGVVYLKMLGVGTAVAVAVDAVVIRGVLLPAAMRIAGAANWWRPRRSTPDSRPRLGEIQDSDERAVRVP